MLSLFKTTDTFMPYGFSAPSVPVFVDERHMSIVAIPSLWMIYLATVPGSTRSPKTWMSYAVGVLDWLRACEAAGWDWRTVREEHIAQYRNNLLRGQSPFTKRRYARSTANGYVRSICAFYEWAAEHSYIERCPVRSVKRAVPAAVPSDVLAHLGPTGRQMQRRVLAVRPAPERLPRFFTIEERRRFLPFLEPRDRLFVRWALYTGARIHEIAALTIRQIPAFGSYEAGRHCAIPITVTKGSHERSLFAPSFLIDETRQYIRAERRKILLDATGRGTRADSEALWLGRWGTQITTTHARLRFQAALRKADISQGVFHDLRHTYAITMLDRLMARSSDPRARAREPLVALKHLLGHSSLKSTERYLRAREAYLGDLIDDDLEAPDV